MAYNDDADFIRGELERQIERLLSTYYSGYVVRKGKAYLTPKNAKDLGSFVVNLTGPHKAQWYRHSQKIGGGLVELLSYHLTNGVKAYAQAFKEARAFLGIEGQVDHEASERHRRENEDRRARAEAQEQAQRERRAETAADIWAQCRPIAGTVAEKYLITRGLVAPKGGWPECLGHHRGLVHELEDAKPVFPCLVARVDDIMGDVCAIWRIYLDPQSGRKADVENAKLGLGPAGGGAIRIGGLAPRIGVAEGVETSLAAWAMGGFRRPVWSLLSTAGMAGFEIPPEITRIDIFPDGDMRAKRKDGEYVPEPLPPGMRAAQALAARLKELGLKHTVQPEPPQGSDYLDLFNQSKGSGEP